MPLTKLQFRPGINRETTSYSNEGGWFDCDKIRFNFGLPQKLGGWEKYSSSTYLGTARRLHNWVALDGSNYLGVGTHLKYYIEEGGTFNDITPVRASTTNSTTFSATNGTFHVGTSSDDDSLVDDVLGSSGSGASPVTRNGSFSATAGSPVRVSVKMPYVNLGGPRYSNIYNQVAINTGSSGSGSRALSVNSSVPASGAIAFSDLYSSIGS